MENIIGKTITIEQYDNGVDKEDRISKIMQKLDMK